VFQLTLLPSFSDQKKKNKYKNKKPAWPNHQTELVFILRRRVVLPLC